MKKKDKVIIASVIIIIGIAAVISYFIFLYEPTYPLESDKLIGTWYNPGLGFGNWTLYFYSNGSGKEIQGSCSPEPLNDTFLWEISNEILCLDYTKKNTSGCMQGKFIGDYNHLELKVAESMPFEFKIKFKFEKID